MKKSILALGIAVGLSTAFSAAHADETEMVAPFASRPLAQMPEGATQAPFQTRRNSAALRDYQQNINPNSNIPTTGIYDQEDRFEDPTGRPLPGWGSVNGEGAGDN